MNVFRTTKWTWLVLFTSLSTLLCCALPILLVTLGMGAAVATMAASFPMLIFLSQNKLWTFSISGAVLLVGGYLLYRSGQSCPTDPELARYCLLAQKWNKRIYWFSVLIWIIGFFTACALLPVSMYFGWY